MFSEIVFAATVVTTVKISQAVWSSSPESLQKAMAKFGLSPQCSQGMYDNTDAWWKMLVKFLMSDY